MRSKRFPVLPVALFLLSALLQAPALVQPPSLYDEGLTLVGADRILRGEVPYRDFWNTHAPAQISVVAALFRVFGATILVERVYDLLVRAGLAVAVFALAGRMGAGAGALVAWAAATLVFGQFLHAGYVTPPALLCAFAGLLVLLACPGDQEKTTGRRRGALALAGAAGGLAVLFRHDLGLEAVAAGTLVIWVGHAVRRETPRTLGAAARRAAGDSLWYLGGAAAVTLPVAALFLALGTPVHRLKLIFFEYPFLLYPQYRALPLPRSPAALLASLLPAVIIVAGLARGLVGVRREGGTRGRSLPLLALGLLGLLSFPQAYTRVNPTQQLPVVVVALALLPALFAPGAARGRVRATLLPLAGAAALALLLAGPSARYAALARGLPARGTAATEHGIPRARGVPLNPAQAEAVRAVRRMTAPGDALYVGLGRHDKARSNDALFSFLADRRCATYYHNLLPGLITAAGVQREVLAELRSRRPAAVVLWSLRDDAREPNRSRESSGVDLLDRGIREDYARARVVGPYEIWTPRGAPAIDGQTGYTPAP